MPLQYKKRRVLFEKQTWELLHRLGAKSDPTWRYPWPHYKIETTAGVYEMSVHSDLWLADKPWSSGAGTPWISGRFDDIARANDAPVDNNRHSGKWNHHYWHNWKDDFAEGFKLLEHELRRVLPA